jgi:acetylornithine deacetylase/succinyl-diaminopimelate desuccinylase-like protein
MIPLLEQVFERTDWTSLSSSAQWTLEQALAVQQIPAPTFNEQARALYVAAQFAELGLRAVEQDSLGNVYGYLAGSSSSAASLMVSAHTDTVFPAETNLSISKNDHIISAPGLGDNSIGVAGMMALAHFLRAKHITPSCGIWFVATTREEGLGDLGGMIAAFARLKDKIAAVINLEGVAFGHVYNSGIAVRRLHVRSHAAGGHSWLHFGQPSALHNLILLAANICRIQPAQSPRTTFNIGLMNGGTAINALAAEADFWLDMRSETVEALAQLEAQIRREVADAARAHNITVEVVGDRPAGMLSPSHSLVQDALASLRLLGVHGNLETGSTDANIPLSQGYPAVTIGITRGGHAHRLDEYIETKPIQAGIQQLVLLALTTAERIALLS